MVNVPEPLVVASRFKPVPLLVAVTCAPGTMALFGSVTVPLRVAVEDWACATAKGTAQRVKSSRQRVIVSTTCVSGWVLFDKGRWSIMVGPPFNEIHPLTHPLTQVVLIRSHPLTQMVLT